MRYHAADRSYLKIFNQRDNFEVNGFCFKAEREGHQPSPLEEGKNHGPYHS